MAATMQQLSIAQKNDQFRQTMTDCRVVLTQGVAQSKDRGAVIEAVRAFCKFTKDDDPYNEHDFAFLEVNGQRLFFKFDYYDASYEFFKEDGNRVLTIGQADEY